MSPGTHPRIDPELRKAIPPLSTEERAGLQASIAKEGCRDALVIWAQGNVLLDGHNRLEICKDLGKPYKTKLVTLPDRAAAKEWIIRNQFARRNLSPFQRAELALELEPLIAGKAKERQREGGKSKLVQNSAQAPDEKKTRAAVAKAARVSHDTIAKVKLISRKADEKTKEKLRAGALTINSVHRGIVKEERVTEMRRKAAAETEVKPGVLSALSEGAGRFRAIYVDPPWSYSDGGCDGGVDAEYATMSLEQLQALGGGALAHPDGCHLWRWTTWPMIRERAPHTLLDAWGFRWVGEFVWKKPGFGVGRWLRPATEILILAVKGDLKLLSDGKETNAFREAPRGKHSEKPEEFYEVIETLSPGPYVELFARRERDKWMRWGNEA